MLLLCAAAWLRGWLAKAELVDASLKVTATVEGAVTFSSVKVVPLFCTPVPLTSH